MTGGGTRNQMTGGSTHRRMTGYREKRSLQSKRLTASLFSDTLCTKASQKKVHKTPEPQTCLAGSSRFTRIRPSVKECDC
eukprot:1138227-Pelagomonas_calceolata.AAC.6